MAERHEMQDYSVLNGDSEHWNNCSICLRLLSGHLLRHNKNTHTKLVVCMKGNGWEYQPKEENLR